MKTNTIYITIGPSQCGKSSFSLKLKESLESLGENGSVLASDDLRREVGGDLNLNYQDNMDRMNILSQSAFELLSFKLNQFTKFPQNQDFVIIDSTGLDTDFRKSIIQLAKKNNYKVVALLFNYSGHEEYFKYFRGDINKAAISRHIKNLKTKVIPFLERKEMEIIKIQDWNHEPIIQKIIDSVSIGSSIKAKTKLDDSIEWMMIGDIHGCLHTFKDLLIKAGFEISPDDIVTNPRGKKILLLGDLVDKGSYSLETLQFALKNKEIMKWIDDNHATFIKYYLDGNQTGLSDEFMDIYFDSRKIFEKEENKQLLIQYLELSLPFASLNKGSIIATHSPCPSQYLGKIDLISRKYQRNWRDYKTEFSKLLEEANMRHPIRVFGHVATKEGIKHKNLIGLDTGAVHQDGRLTGLVIANDKKMYYHSVPRNEKDTFFNKPLESVHDLIPDSQEDFDIDALTPKDKNRIKYSQKDKINFISGTISPSHSTETEFEPIVTALDYYKKHGVTDVVLQKKHMGSRAEVYLTKDGTGDFATSRNGYPIRGFTNEQGERTDDLKSLFQKLRNTDFIKKLLEENRVIILDCELMPWCSMGKGLIQNTFKTYGNLVQQEVEFKEKYNFDKVIEQMESKKQELLKQVDFFKTPKKELIEILKSNNYEFVKNAISYKHTKTSIHRKGLDEYLNQVELYGKPSEAQFLPFAIIKLIANNGENKVITNQEEFLDAINTYWTPSIKISIDDLDKASSFFKQMVEENQAEGIMVKPIIQTNRIVPAIKVRNEKYLHIIYGHDFLSPEKYNKLCKKKNVNKKINISRKEWAIGLSLLDENYDSIPDSQTYAKKMANIIETEEVEKTLDPRL